MVAADEHHSVREWVLYHHMIGVNKFYIWDDTSTPPMYEVLEDLIRGGLVDYLYVPHGGMQYEREGTTVQDAKYNTCLYRFGSRHTWMGEGSHYLPGMCVSGLPNCVEGLRGLGSPQELKPGPEVGDGLEGSAVCGEQHGYNWGQ